MKKCPFCAEEIQDAAIKCRYCGSMLNEPATVDASVDEFEDARELARQDEESDARVLLVACPACGRDVRADAKTCPTCGRHTWASGKALPRPGWQPSKSDLVRAVLGRPRLPVSQPTPSSASVAGGIPTSVPKPAEPPPVKKLREFKVLGWPGRDLNDVIHHPAEGPLATIPEPSEPMSFETPVVASLRQAVVTKWGNVLSAVLGDDEEILDAVNGHYAGRVGILVATQKRVVFADDKELRFEFPFDKIIWIQSKNGWLLGSLEIFKSDQKAIVENVDKTGGRAFSEGFRGSAALGLYGRKLGRPGQKLQLMQRVEVTPLMLAFGTALGLLIVAVPLYLVYLVGGWMLSVYRSQPPVQTTAARPTEEPAPPAPAPAATPAPAAPSAEEAAKSAERAEAAREAVASLLALGVIKRMDLASGKFYISGPQWEGYELDRKETLVKIVSLYREAEYRGLPQVTLYDSRSGKELASYGAFSGVTIK